MRNGVDTDVFRPGLPRPDEAPARFLVYAGTTSAWQGADVFVRAMPAVRAAVPDAELVLLGQGSDWDDLAALGAELAPGAVHVRRLVPAAEAAAWAMVNEVVERAALDDTVAERTAALLERRDSVIEATKRQVRAAAEALVPTSEPWAGTDELVTALRSLLRGDS